MNLSSSTLPSRSAYAIKSLSFELRAYSSGQASGYFVVKRGRLSTFSFETSSVSLTDSMSIVIDVGKSEGTFISAISDLHGDKFRLT